MDEGPQDVADLVRRAQAGDAQALGALCSTHLPVVHGVVARGLGGNGSCSADVEDVVQETMLRTVTSLGSLRDPSRFRSWLVAIAYRQMQDHHRTRRRRPSLQDPVVTAALPDDAPAPADLATAGVEADAGRRDLALAARWLDPAHQGVLGLWWQETCGVLGRGDLARALGVGRRHAAVRVQRMRAQLAVARGVVAAWDAVPRCPGLAEAAARWDGAPSPLWRKRLDRHVRACDACLGRSADLVPPERLVPVLGALPVPVLLADQVRDTVAQGAGVGAPSAGWWQGLVEQLQQTGGEPVGRPVAAAVTAVAVAVGGGAAMTVVVGGEEPPVSVVAEPSVAPAPEPSDRSAPPAPRAPQVAPVASEGNGADLYVSPDGSDTADGSFVRPFATLAHAVDVVRPGQTIVLRGGTHAVTEPIRITTDGTRERRIVLTAQEDEVPVLDLSGVPADEWPLVQEADHWTVSGLEILGSHSYGYLCVSCEGAVFEDLDVHDNVRAGLLLRGEGTVGNVVRDSDFHHNHDDTAGGRAGIGLGVMFGSGEGNLVEGNRFDDNADDGVDLGSFTSPVTLRGNEASGNGIDRWGMSGWTGGGGGFTLGGGDAPLAVAHVLEGNVARGNEHHGFADGGNRGAIRLVGNVARDNGAAGYYLVDAAAVLERNEAEGNDVSAKLGETVRDDGSLF